MVLLLTSYSIMAQVNPKDINGAKNIRGVGTTLDTNVTFTLSMTRDGDTTLIDSARLGDSIVISATMRPEATDVGSPADVIIVDAATSAGFTMRDQDGNFVTWSGKVPDLVPYLEGVTLGPELPVEIFAGQLGVTGSHRIFVGFLVGGDTLYFTPQALKFDILETSARDQAIELFNSTISPDIVQARCIACHVDGGVADGQSQHIFVRTSNPDHLSINFTEIENLHSAKGTAYILDKVQGLLDHGGAKVLMSGSTDFNNMAAFLDLLDQAAP